MRNWLTPRRSQSFHASSGVVGRRRARRARAPSPRGRRGRATFALRQPADATADHDDPCHSAPLPPVADPISETFAVVRPGGSLRAPNPGARRMAEFARRPRLGSSVMHVLRVVRVLLAVLIVAAVVGAGSSVLSARPDLQKAKRNVDTSWSTLVAATRPAVRAARRGRRHSSSRSPGRSTRSSPTSTRALAHWRDVREHGGVAAQVEAANDARGARAPARRDRRARRRACSGNAATCSPRSASSSATRRAATADELQPDVVELRARAPRARAHGRGVGPRRRRDPRARHDARPPERRPPEPPPPRGAPA